MRPKCFSFILSLSPLQSEMSSSPYRHMKWAKRLIIVVVVLVVLVLLGVFIFLDSIVKKGVETVGPAVTKVDVKLGSAKISPFSGSGTLKNFVLGNPEGYKTPSAIQVGSVGVSVAPASLRGDKII